MFTCDIGADGETPDQVTALEWKLKSLSHGQELGKLADLASDWLFTFV